MTTIRTRTLFTGFGLSLVLLLVVMGSALRYLNRMAVTFEAVSETHEVQGELNRVSENMRHIEAGGSGYILSGDEKYLGQVEAGLASIRESLDLIQQKIQDPEQKQNLARLSPLVEERITIVQQTIEAYKQSGFEAAQQSFTSGRAKPIVDQIFEILAEMNTEQRRQLDQGWESAVREVLTAYLLISLGSLLGCALLIGVFILVLLEKRLRGNDQAALDRFFTLSIDLLCIAKSDGHFLRVSPSFSQALGWSEKELTTRPFLEFVHPDDHAATIQEVERQLNQGEKVLNFENRYLHADGSWRVLSWKSTPHGNGLMYGAARDVTDLRAAQAALQSSEDLVRCVLNSMVTSIAVLDETGEIIAVNEAWERFPNEFGPETTIQGGAVGTNYLDQVEPGEATQDLRFSELIHGLRGVLSGSRDSFLHDYHCETPAGRRWFSMHATPLSRIERGAVVVHIDVTGQRETQESIKRLNEELQVRSELIEETNRELESFSYSVSHDLRAPLRHIHGYVELLKKASVGQLSEKTQRYLDIIAAASAEMGQLIDDLLAFSRMSRTEFEEVRISLDTLVEESIRILDMSTRDREIVWRIHPLPEALGDAAAIRQVFANLIGNAVKYTRNRGQAEIEIGCRGHEDGHVVIYVKDNGAGFDMAYSHKLFGVFQRLHRSEEFEGTGIGLATVRRIVARHGGRTWAEGVVGEGATFSFTLKPAAAPWLGWGEDGIRTEK